LEIATEVPLVISLSIGLKIHYRLQTKQYKPVDRRFAHPREDGERNLWLAAISLGNLKFVTNKERTRIPSAHGPVMEGGGTYAH
jgi:hypothetical protein